MRSLSRSSAEVVLACLSPCVWVWGFWFGFALRCVALLCGVFIFGLALFLAGGPFLPSLSVNLFMYGVCSVTAAHLVSGHVSHLGALRQAHLSNITGVQAWQHTSIRDHNRGVDLRCAA
jgi:hypothetical protein